MGGTSTDVCLVLDGAPEPAGERSVGGLPGPPTVTRRAHHRRRRRFDRPDRSRRRARRRPGERRRRARAGLLRPGRHRADGHRRRSRRRPDPGRRRASRASAVSTSTRPAPRSTAQVSPPTACIAVVDAAMEQALRAVSVERGVDPTGLALVAFGGAGPLHACALAEALDMATVIVPARAGVLSAVGLLAAPRQHDVVRSWPTPTDHAGLDDALSALAAEAVDALALRRRVGREVETAVDCRYAGQSHELRVPTVSKRSRPSIGGATATTVRARRSRSWRSERRPAGRRRSRSATSRAPNGTSRSGRQSSPSPTARSGCPTAGGPTRIRRHRRARSSREPLV